VTRRSLLGAVFAVLAAGGFVATGGGQSPAVSVPASFAARVAALSEPGGYFDTDNLISNERTYLHVLPALAREGVKGGAYVGVGPDQNFSYIAAIRPELAIIIDIRRDNLLLHLLFKALFQMAETRVDYLALLTGRPVPRPVGAWRDRPVDAIAAYVDGTAVDAASLPALRARVAATVRSFGVPLSPADMATIARFHGRFIDDGLALQFNTTGRAPQWHYPTFGDLIRADDGRGRQANYLASETDFQFLKALQARDRIIPVVGDLAGPVAMRAVAGFLRSQATQLSSFYSSNVEFYLWRNGQYGAFEANLAAFPRADHAVMIRSNFGGGGSASEVVAID
jgi:hypothetical protein